MTVRDFDSQFIGEAAITVFVALSLYCWYSPECAVNKCV